MRLVDANILIYAFDKNSPFHRSAVSWLDDKLNGIPKLGLPWQSLLAFTRIVSNPRIYAKPVSPGQAWKQVKEWTGTRAAWIPLPRDNHAEIVNDLLEKVSVSANDIPDVHLAALAIEHGLNICSTDTGFSRFPDVEWDNPLSPL